MIMAQEDSDIIIMEPGDEPVTTLLAWGSTTNGELGLGGIEEELIQAPRTVPFSKSVQVIQVACGNNHSLLLLNSGKVYSCGSNEYGQLGHRQANHRRFQLVEALSSQFISQIACGENHSMALNKWGQLYVWGDNSHCQLGLRHELCPFSETPKLMKPLANYIIVQVQCGSHHNIALTNCGSVFTWGSNIYGQLGIGIQNANALFVEPERVQGLGGSPIIKIACGANHSIAVAEGGTVFAWGKNTFGQLGTGLPNEDYSIYRPVKLCPLKNLHVKHVECGDDFSVFLLKDGGVMTCGAGTFGQLGHGVQGHEWAPRKVQELMGSMVTQVACGRRFSLALVGDTRRLFYFGPQGKGNFLAPSALNQEDCTPQVMHGPWVSGVRTSIDATAPVVWQIYAGGNQAFALTAPQFKAQDGPDFRVLVPSTQILAISMEKMAGISEISANGVVDLEDLRYLEQVFASPVCINNSFRLENPADATEFNIDFGSAIKVFTWIAQCKNSSITTVIYQAITNSLLRESYVPVDSDCLRIYIILPFYQEFANPKNYRELQCNFAQQMLNLGQDKCLEIGKCWFSCKDMNILHHIIENYKEVVCHIGKKIPRVLNGPDVIRSSTGFCASHLQHEETQHLVLAVKMLELMFKTCQNITNCSIPLDIFQIPQLLDLFQMQADYAMWIDLQHGQSANTNFLLLQYPFILDLTTKATLVQFEQVLRMQRATRSGATYTRLHIRRNRIVEDTIYEISRIPPRDLRLPLQIKFDNEEAVDVGGVTKEYFLLLLKEILDPKYGMFKHYHNSNLIWFQEGCMEDIAMYHIIGMVCGLAVYNFTPVDLHFPLALYKKILGHPVNLSDFTELEPVIGQSLNNMLGYVDADFEEVFDLDFVIPIEYCGIVKLVNLKPEGNNIKVTKENREEYVTLYLNHIFNAGVEMQFNNFMHGFNMMSGKSHGMKLLDPPDLQFIVHGTANYDWDVLEVGTKYEGIYNREHPTIINFWLVFHQLAQGEKKNFLQFLTGSDRVPVQGMQEIAITIVPVMDLSRLPVAHTCFNTLDLPSYRTKEQLRHKLLQAIQQTSGFSLL